MVFVPEYNFFAMNDSGVIDTARRLRFNDDVAATQHARDMHHTGRVEVWTGKRQVCIVPPAIDRRAGAPRRSN